MKKYVTPENSIDVLGITHKNIVLEKIICGDSSDNIKGIKGVGKTMFVKTFPDVVKYKKSVDDIVNEASRINEERVKEKKKPLKVLENIVNKVTEGCQGNDIYDINRKIIDLSEPMMTEEAVESMKALMYAPIDPDGRDMKNVYDIITKLGMNDLLSENSFGNLFGIFEGLIKREKNFFAENN
jgi:5'-3' exonuclease